MLDPATGTYDAVQRYYPAVLGDELLEIAAVTRLRQAKVIKPVGIVAFSGWYPVPSETCQCCKTITLPSGKFMWSLYKHCLTAKHVAQLFGVDERKLAASLRSVPPVFIEVRITNGRRNSKVRAKRPDPVPVAEAVWDDYDGFGL